MVRATAPQINISEKIIKSQELLDIKTASLLPSNTFYGNNPVIVKTVEDLIEFFDYPTEENYKYWFQIWNYLQYNNSGIWVTRPIKTTDHNYSIQLTGTTITDNTQSNSNLYEYDLASNLIFNTTNTNSLEVYNRFVENESKTAVVVCSSEAYWQNSISNEEIDIIRDIGVYDYQTLSSALNNIYQIKFDEYAIEGTQIFSDVTNTDSYIVAAGNLTHIEVDEYIRLEGSTTELITVAYDYDFTSASLEPSIGQKVVGMTSGTIGYVYSVTDVGEDEDSPRDPPVGVIGVITIYSMDGLLQSEKLEINDSGTGDDMDITAVDYSLDPDATIMLTGNHQYLTTSDTVLFDGDETNYSISDITYDLTNDITLLKTSKTTSAWDSISQYNTLIIESDTTSILVDSAISVSAPMTLMYLAQDWNDVDQGLGDAFGTVLEHAENDDIWQYNYTTNAWEESNAMLIASDYYYIKDKDLVYQFLASVLTLSTLTAFEYDSTTAIKDIYDSKIVKYDNSIYTFEDLFDREPDWDEDEFALGILRKNRDSDKFELVETYILNYDRTSEIEVYNDSEFVYIKMNESLIDADRVDTYNQTIEDLTITVDETKDYSDASYFTNAELYNIVKVYLDKDQYSVNYLLGFKSYLDNNLYSLDLMSKISNERSNSVVINSIWEEADFFGLTSDQILDRLISYYGFKNSFQMIKSWNKYSSFFTNMKMQYDSYNEVYRWIPLNGDIAGLFVENEKTGSGVGVGNNIKNVIRLLFNLSNYNYRKELNLNGLNVVQYDNLKNPIIFDSVTMIKDLESIFRELHIRKNMNTIENDLRVMLFSRLLKVNPDERELKSMISNYLSKLVPTLLKSQKCVVKVSGSTALITLTLEFTEILRTVNIEITIADGNINIIEK